MIKCFPKKIVHFRDENDQLHPWKNRRLARRVWVVKWPSRCGFEKNIYDYSQDFTARWQLIFIFSKAPAGKRFLFIGVVACGIF